MRGYRFYESQASGVGRYFLDSLFSDIDSLGLNAGMHPVFFGRYHRLLPRRFPWVIYYRIEEDTVLVYAVLDNRSDPGRAWQRFSGRQG